MIIEDHPHRATILAELHARPLILVPSVSRVRRLVFLMPAATGSMAAVMQRYKSYCQSKGVAGTDDIKRQHSFATASRHVTWEFHTEFVTITWFSALNDWDNWPDDIGLEVIEDGKLVGATRIDVTADETVPEHLFEGFQQTSLCCSNVVDGKAQVLTDFVPDADGFTRFELACGSLADVRRAILVRRLLEVETYRNMALLSLPLAQSLSPELNALEQELTRTMDKLDGFDRTLDVHATLGELQHLSLRSGQLFERLSYRFSAGNAYGEILRSRLEHLEETSSGKGHKLSRFINNRVEPALATCNATERRLKLLSEKVDRAIGLLDVRIGLQMQVQNAAVLDNIAKTAHSQFLLQRTVEGLSTIAISYYLLGIVGYLLAGPLEHLHWEKATTLSVTTPLVVFVVWMMVRAVRKSHMPETKH